MSITQISINCGTTTLSTVIIQPQPSPNNPSPDTHTVRKPICRQQGHTGMRNLGPWYTLWAPQWDHSEYKTSVPTPFSVLLKSFSDKATTHVGCCSLLYTSILVPEETLRQPFDCTESFLKHLQEETGSIPDLGFLNETESCLSLFGWKISSHFQIPLKLCERGGWTNTQAQPSSSA